MVEGLGCGVLGLRYGLGVLLLGVGVEFRGGEEEGEEEEDEDESSVSYSMTRLLRGGREGGMREL